MGRLNERTSRIGQHIPVGVFTVFCGYEDWHYGLLFGAGFLTYQVMQFVQLRRKGWLDIYGWLIGIGIAVSVVFGLRLAGVI